MAEAPEPKTPVDIAPGKVKVMIAEPSSGYVDSFVYDNRKDFIMELARLEARSEFKFGTGNTARLHVSAAREMMADAAIEAGFDYIFMVDDDMLIPRDCFERMYKALKDHDAEVSAPLCTQRLEPYNPVVWKMVKQTGPDGKEGLETVFYHDFKPNEVILPDAVGFGVVLIAVSLLKRMKKPYFFSNTQMGEDIFFCLSARINHKAKIVCDTSIKIQHMGYPIARSEYDWIKQDKKRFDEFKHLYSKILTVDNDPKIEQLNAQAVAA